MSNFKACYRCGIVHDHDYVFHKNNGECDREMAYKKLKALESIAESLEKMANPPINMEDLV